MHLVFPNGRIHTKKTRCATGWPLWYHMHLHDIWRIFTKKKHNHFISIKNAVLNFPFDIPKCPVVDFFANIQAHAASVRRSASMESGLYVFEEVPPNWAQLGDGWFRFCVAPVQWLEDVPETLKLTFFFAPENGGLEWPGLFYTIFRWVPRVGLSWSFDNNLWAPDMHHVFQHLEATWLPIWFLPNLFLVQPFFDQLKVQPNPQSQCFACGCVRRSGDHCPHTYHKHIHDVPDIFVYILHQGRGWCSIQLLTWFLLLWYSPTLSSLVLSCKWLCPILVGRRQLFRFLALGCLIRFQSADLDKISLWAEWSTHIDREIFSVHLLNAWETHW